MLIERTNDLEHFASRLRDADDIALDVEGDGLFRYRARLCTVQLAMRGDIRVIDALACEDRSALGDVLGADGPRKIVHDAAFDARMLHGAGLRLGNVLDTAVTARFVGESATGLASLLSKRFGIVLPKEQQQADWGRRPIDDDALMYLVDDVRHLFDLAESLLEDVRRLDIAQEIAEECRYVLWRAAEGSEENVIPPWTRISGATDLSAPARAVLRELAVVRENAAQRWDVPAFKVISNDALLAISRKRPRTPSELGAIPGAASGRARSLSGDILIAVRRGETAGDAPPEEIAMLSRGSMPPEERVIRRAREQALGAWRGEAAAQRGVDRQVILPGHCLNDLAARGAKSADDLRGVRGLGEFRVERYGDPILSALRGADGAA